MFESEIDPRTVRRFSRADYQQLIDIGVLENEPVELLRGLLVTMSPQGVRHVSLSGWLVRELTLRLGRSFNVRAHSPYPATDDSMPEPDVSVVEHVTDSIGYHTSPLLLVEVSNSSLRQDRRVKAPLYAEAGVPEYWIVDVSGDERKVEVHTDPSPGGYRRIEVLLSGDVLRPTRLPLEIPISELPWEIAP